MQFSKNPEVLNQFLRQMIPNIGPYDAEINTDAFAVLFDKIGPAIFVTHSQGGGQGWVTALKTNNIKGIVAYEPGSGFLFPEGEVPADLPNAGGALSAAGVPLPEFLKLTRIPIVIFTATTSQTRQATCPVLMVGACAWRWRGSGETP